LREYYSAPFRMGFVDGGARCYMASYNAWNKIPMTVHPILKNLTMKEWGVDGIIGTDAGALGNMVSQHKSHANLPEAAAASIKAGINMILAIMEDYKGAVKTALAQNLLTESDIDASLRGSLRVAFRLGLLNPPAMAPFTKLKGTPDPVNSAAHNDVARQVARESIVLLKNANGLLPLDRLALKQAAVIGKLAEAVLPDFYGGLPPYTSTPLDAIKSRVGPQATVDYAVDNTGGRAVEIARATDLAIVVVGNHPTCNRTPTELIQSLMSYKRCAVPGEGMESSDRSSLELEQEDLIKEVYQANPKTVVVLVASAPYAINWTQENVPAILHTSHNGQEEGNAVADVLFGDYNPAGRLVQTWVRSLDQLPPMMDYNIRNGRTYMCFRGEPLYAFGYGLSYTKFRYRNLRTSAQVFKAGGKITMSVNITNTGNRDGDEVAQFYVRHPASKVIRPAKELKGFERVSIPRGKTRRVTVPLKASALAYWDEERNRWDVEAGPVEVLVGGSSADLRLSRTIRVVE
jgi:beta-glucosidase